MTSLSVLQTIAPSTPENRYWWRTVNRRNSTSFGLSYEEAVWRKQGGLLDDYPMEVPEPFVEGIVQQVSRPQFFIHLVSMARLTIWYCRWMRGIDGIDDMIESRLSTTTSIANPFTDNPLI